MGNCMHSLTVLRLGFCLLGVGWGDWTARVRDGDAPAAYEPTSLLSRDGLTRMRRSSSRPAPCWGRWRHLPQFNHSRRYAYCLHMLSTLVRDENLAEGLLTHNSLQLAG
jgi:hypothetical protein